MANLAKKMTEAEGRRRTVEAVKQFNDAKTLTAKALATIQQCVEDGTHQAVGMRLDEWLEEHFHYSSSYLFARIQQRRAMQAIGVPQKTIEKIPEQNARQLVRLPEKYRKTPAVIEQAVKLEPKQFKEVVDEIRVTKLGISQEVWKTLAVRVPMAVYDQLIAAQDKVASILQLDLQDDAVRTKNLITVWEAVAVLVNSTDESRLKTEIEGG